MAIRKIFQHIFVSQFLLNIHPSQVHWCIAPVNGQLTPLPKSVKIAVWCLQHFYNKVVQYNVTRKWWSKCVHIFLQQWHYIHKSSEGCQITFVQHVTLVTSLNNIGTELQKNVTMSCKWLARNRDCSCSKRPKQIWMEL